MTYTKRTKRPKHNPVAKFMHRYNKAVTMSNKKKDYKRKPRNNKQYEVHDEE